jgi:hypothetical protein
VKGRNFVLFTDHKPLTYAFDQKLDKSSPRQFRYLDYIGQFTTDIRYVEGLDNSVADVLCRIEAIGKSVDHQTLAAAQESDIELRNIIKSGTSALCSKKILFPDNNVALYCGISGDNVRPFVPKPLRRSVFDSLHGLSHPGIRATHNLVTTRFVWPSINKDCRNWTCECIPCERCKITRHVSSPDRTKCRPLPTYLRRHYRDAVLTRIPILSNVYRPILAMARSHTFANNDRSRTPVRVKTLRRAVPVARH